jgi:hypothetical protein
MFIL